MNTPYPELTRDPAQRHAYFTAWNQAIEKSRREYRLNPIAACGVATCVNLITGRTGSMCITHAGPNVRRAT